MPVSSLSLFHNTVSSVSSKAGIMGNSSVDQLPWLKSQPLILPPICHIVFFFFISDKEIDQGNSIGLRSGCQWKKRQVYKKKPVFR